jgi:rare lipoprotein A
MRVTALGTRRGEIPRHAYLSRDSNTVIPLAGAALFAYCVICAAGNGAHADSRLPQLNRDLGAFAAVKKDVPCNQSEGGSPASFAGLLVPATSAGGTIVGVASYYNPYVELDDAETASGEQYDADKWTAAIQIDLRDSFGGVGFGKDYRVAYALVESGDKRMIVKINDVGPLKPGRVIDLSERAMRYFDETLLVGLIPGVKVTLLPGGDWTPGPIVSGGVKTYGCGSREARRDDSPKRPSVVENDESQAERHQRLDARSRRDQQRGAAPLPRIGADDQPVEVRPLRAGKNHLREADLSEETALGDGPAKVRKVRARSDRKVRCVDAEMRRVEEAAQ